MENLVSLTILIVVFMSILLFVVYVADMLACKFIKWLGLEDIDNEYNKTPTIGFSNEDKAFIKMVEGELFESVY